MVIRYSQLLATFSDISNVFMGITFKLTFSQLACTLKEQNAVTMYGYHVTNVEWHCGWATSLLFRDVIAY